MLSKIKFDNPASMDPVRDNPENGPNETTVTMDPGFGINLQLFADGDPVGDQLPIDGTPSGGDPAPASGGEPAPASGGDPAPATGGEPGQSGGSGEPGGIDINAAVAELLKEHGAENFKDVGSLVKSYKESQATQTRLFQELASMREMMQNMQTANQQQTGSGELTPEQIEELNEEFNNKFLDNPVGALKEFFGNMLKEASGELIKPLEEKINPLAQKMELKEKQELRQMQAAALFNANPAAAAYVNEIKNYIAANKEVLDKLSEVEGVNPFEFAYHAVKGMKMPDNPAELFNNENFVNLAMQNKDFVNKVLQAHMQSVKSGQPPTQIAGQTSGAPVAPPSDKARPTTIAEATKKYYEAKGWTMD